ncbi:MAG: hypothetical protein CM15mP62_31360 [Rhodospirillaceae bacterium]|nr:MAG: hypothetical protein CM15mP62_31360 [Rhodospirillaceae bacterium]
MFLDERERLLESLGDKKAMILKNHGLLTVGRTVPDAFIRLHALERSCQIQVDAGAAGTLNTLSDNVASKSGADRDEFLNSNKVEAGQLEFAALMRKIDRIDQVIGIKSRGSSDRSECILEKQNAKANVVLRVGGSLRWLRKMLSGKID